MTTRKHMLSLGWAALGILTIVLGALRADAAWHLAGNLNSIDYDSNGAPVNGNGNDLFKRTLQGGTKGVSFHFTFCCTDPTAFCPQGLTLGVMVQLTVRVVTPGGVTDAKTTLPIISCAQCGTATLSLTEAQTSINGVVGAPWVMKASKVLVDADISCICCNGGTWSLSLDNPGTTGFEPLK